MLGLCFIPAFKSFLDMSFDLWFATKSQSSMFLTPLLNLCRLFVHVALEMKARKGRK